MGLIYLLLFVFVIVDFFASLAGGEPIRIARLLLARYIILAVTNLSFIHTDLAATNNCCGGGWNFLSPFHRLSVYVVLGLGMAAYFYCAHRKRLASPVVEIIVNCLLLAGVVLYVVFSIHMGETWLWLLGPLPAILLFVMMLMQNHRRAVTELEGLRDWGELPLSEGRVVQFCWFLLQQKAWKKFPVLLLLCLPLLLCVVAVLLLFGQKPDSLVKAFTETYKHGLSQLDIDCNQVDCGGGHFLCTIAAKGHKGLVKPLRAGVRAGGPIKCNRQLLVANAFEEWLEQHVSWLHAPVRRLYNHVGSYLHRHYGAFDRKWVSDMVYLLMKPLEWLFLVTLYVVDRRPENRIAQQYMSRVDRESLRTLSKS
ncbi:MAG TPA: DUF6688 family protein [Puia sp.]|nr:DUF6688 family protein [Puia sp.]